MKQENIKTRNTLLQKLEDIHTYEAILATDNAFKNAVMLVSLAINVTVMVVWMLAELS